ncbi:DUF736 family protein [Mesorhizobium sp. ISC15]|uniref:DUF736 family protein n=1 Tax=Mesorhizobium sp. ISC15 TaxID=3076429 RepID=UPI00301D49D2
MLTQRGVAAPAPILCGAQRGRKPRKTGVGAAWLNENEETGKTHISLTIDAPELPRKLHANLGPAPGQDDDDVFAIIWNRPKN